MLSRAVGRLPRLLNLSECEAFPKYRPTWLISVPSYQPKFARQSTSTAHSRGARFASSSSTTRWKTRQSNDKFAKEAKVAGLKSRAAFKLLEIDSKHRIFRPGDTVVDLGYAPGSWSQVAISRTQPNGRVVGIDIIPAQPPKGVSTIQGDFLSEEIRDEVRRFVQVPERGRARPRKAFSSAWDDEDEALTEDDLEEENRGLLELERASRTHDDQATEIVISQNKTASTQKELDRLEGRVVNVVLSDMSEPWPQTTSTWIKSVSNPYRRMMNTSGMPFRDHAGSMDLCNAALSFCYDTLITGGHFLCKFYQGTEDHALEMRLKKLFEKVHRIKPDSSRKESKEAYFLGLRRRPGVLREEVLAEHE